MKQLVAACVAGSVALATAGAVLAQSAKPEDQIKYRQSALFLTGQSFGVLVAMIKGERPYDKDLAAKHAGIVEFVIKLPWGAFAPGTETGNTKAKPEIWLELEDFKAKAEKVQTETAKLAEVAKTGDAAALKAQVGETGKACKACHDKFRNK